MKKMDILIAVLRVLFIVLVAGMILLFVFNRDLISVDTILYITPDNMFLAALFFILLYALKSLSVFFPIVLLQAAAGIMFPIPVALFVSFLGAATEVTVPYVLAKYSSSSKIEKRIKKYPKVQDVISRSSSNELMLSFLLRIIGMLPIDVVSMALGSMKIRYYKYLIGSILGLAPGIIAITIAGSAVKDPRSPAFIISILVTGFIAGISALLYFINYRRAKKKDMAKDKDIDD